MEDKVTIPVVTNTFFVSILIFKLNFDNFIFSFWCFKCYRLRLEKAAEVAKELGFDWFCTTLSISPLKNAEKINEIGNEIAEKYGVEFLPSDFKKKEGFKRSIELSKKYDLYRQNYCGCVYSKK